MIIMTFGRWKTYYDYMECLRLYSVEPRSGSRGEKFVVRKVDNWWKTFDKRLGDDPYGKRDRTSAGVRDR